MNAVPLHERWQYSHYRMLIEIITRLCDLAGIQSEPLPVLAAAPTHTVHVQYCRQLSWHRVLVVCGAGYAVAAFLCKIPAPLEPFFPGMKVSPSRRYRKRLTVDIAHGVGDFLI